MAIELCSENSSAGVSPRISFSHDLCQTDVVPVEPHHFSLRSSSNTDFDFDIHQGFDQDSSSADELFSDGMILPVQIKKKIVKSKQKDQSTAIPPLQYALHEDDAACNGNSKKESSKDAKVSSEAGDDKHNSKSFWRFKRSASLNCGSGYGPSLCPLPLLSRSNSTGSASNAKRSSLSKDGQNHKQHYSQKQYSSVKNYQKPPLKKSYGNYGNGVHINPVLHVPSASLFGLASIFSNGKDKNKKK